MWKTPSLPAPQKRESLQITEETDVYCFLGHGGCDSLP